MQKRTAKNLAANKASADTTGVRAPAATIAPADTTTTITVGTTGASNALGLVAVLAALSFALFSAAGALAQSARINSIIPAGRFFYPGEEVKVRVVLFFDRAPQLQNPEVRYEIVDAMSGAVVAAGSAPFNRTIAQGGWAEIKPELPREARLRWYRADISLWEGERQIAIDGAGGERMSAPIGFGVLPEKPDYASWGEAEAGTAVPGRKVMAFYYTWYGNPEVSNRWVHWPEGGHNPDLFDERGLPDLGTTHHPALGPYDSHDPRVIKQHLEWAEAAGIDVLIATWWGRGDFSDQALSPLLDAAAETNVRITVYYETIPGNREDAALADLRYLLSRYGDHPGFFKHDGEPVIFVYGRAMNQIPYASWERVIQTLKSEYQVKLIADSLDARWAEIFDGLHMYNPVGPVVGGSDMRQLYDTFVWAAESRGKVSSVTVIPGYDDSNIGRPTPIVAPRRDGALYDELWELAVETRPQWVLITSFNEWHEGSEIEPSVEHGDQYLRATAAWAARFKAAPERTLWVARSSVPVVAVPGGEYPIVMNLVRRGGGAVPAGATSVSAGDPGAIAVRWDLPEGWAVTAVEQEESGSETAIRARLSVPDDAEPGEYAVQAVFSWQGYDLKIPGTITVVEAGAAPFDGVGVWTELGGENRAFGLVQRDHPDGVTAPVTIDGVEARTTAPGVTAGKYVYFDVADRFFYDSSGTMVEFGIEFLDDRLGTFRIQYDSSNPFGGPFDGAYTDGPSVTMTGTGEWKTAVVRVPDARFANRQNGATDFRLAVGTNDLVIRRVWVRLLEESVK